MKLEDLKVSRGESVPAFLEKLKRWARTHRLLPGPGISFTVAPGLGTWVRADVDRGSWSHPFQCALAADAVSVAKGTVNNIIPRIGEVRIDGRDENGKEVTAPQVKLKGARPNRDLRSWICLQVKVNLKTRQIDTKDKTAVTMIHTADYDPNARGKGVIDDGSGTGWQPVAELIWNASGIVQRVEAVAHFNQRHVFLPGTGGNSSRHFFCAA